MPSPEVFSERKSSSMMTTGKRNFMGPLTSPVIHYCMNAGPQTRRNRVQAARRRRRDGKARIMGRFAPRGYEKCVAETLATPPAPAATRSPSPTGVRKRRPMGRFFSAAISAASNSIHPTLPTPTTNIVSISAQQQPTQTTPWSTPIRNASRTGPTDDGVGKVRGDPEGQPRGEKAEHHERQQPSRIWPRAGDSPKNREQRKCRRQHHRRDHQHPSGRVQHHGHHDFALGDRTA